MNILITGGAGFIGSRLAIKLAGMGHTVVAVDTLSPQIHGDQTEPRDHEIHSMDGIELHKADVRDKDMMAGFVRSAQAIVHLAAETGTGQSMYRIHHYSDVNIQGTAVILELLSEPGHSVAKLVVASSRAIYGEGSYRCADHGVVYPDGRLPDDLKAGRFEPVCPVCSSELALLATAESARITPNSIYGITKQVQEQMCLMVGETHDISTTALRYQNVYGPGQSLKNPYTGILSIFSTSILNGNDLSIFEDGRESRDFVFVDDVVDATTLAVLDNSRSAEVYNVGYGEATSVIDVATELLEAYSSQCSYTVSGNFRIGDIRHNYADISKIQSHLGYAPKTDFKEGVRLFTDWVKSQAIEDDLYQQSMDELKQKGLYI